MMPLKLDDPHVISRTAFWWERCLVHILRRGDKHAEVLRGLVAPEASAGRFDDLCYPST